MNKSIIVYGSLAYDYQFLAMQELQATARTIHPDETALCPVQAEQMTFGGNAGNIAFYLAKMGCSPILVSTVGYDGALYINRLQSLNLDTSHIETKMNVPTTSIWLMRDLECSVAFFDDRASLERHLDIPGQLIEKSIVHIAPGKPQVTLPALAKVYGLADTVIWDPGQDIRYFDSADIVDCLKNVSILTLNQHELQTLLLQAKADMETILREAIIIETRGDEGVLIHEVGKDVLHIPAIVSPRFVSSWGAGDAFRSGLLYALSQGSSLNDAAKCGCAVASLAVECRETQKEDVARDAIFDRLS